MACLCDFASLQSGCPRAPGSRPILALTWVRNILAASPLVGPPDSEPFTDPIHHALVSVLKRTRTWGTWQNLTKNGRSNHDKPVEVRELRSMGGEALRR